MNETTTPNEYLIEGRQREALQQRTLVQIVLYTCVLGLIWSGLHVSLGLWKVTVPVFVYILLSMLNLLWLRWTENDNRCRFIQLMLILLLPFFTQIGYGGFIPGGAVVLASFIAPLGGLLFHGVEVARAFFYLFVGTVVLAGGLEALGLVWNVGVPEGVSLSFFVVNILCVTGLLYYTVETFLRQRDRLSTLLAERNAELVATLRKLQTMQRQLIQQEKLASLGSLTAGIAHEIKNPLNFINNFAQISAELASELDAEIQTNRDRLHEIADDLLDVLQDLKLTTEKISEHGQRADGIVRSMLEHSRGNKGERRPTALNALVDEYVNLALHGMLAQRPGLEVKVERDYDAKVGALDIVPQEIGRVLINLLNNACYAVHEKVRLHERTSAVYATGASTLDEPYVPTIRVRTRRMDDRVEIQVEDNGPGVPEGIREKVFEPFFTTKPTGSGTGLGLSLSYDIVTQGHGGLLRLEEGAEGGARFVIALPTT